MKFIGPLLALLLLVSCAGFLSADQTKIQIQITISKDRFINSVISDENFKVLSDNIVAEIQKRLLNDGIVSSTNEIKAGEKNILTIEYEYLESDSKPNPWFALIRKDIYVMKGKFNLIDSTTQKVLFNEGFDIDEDKISDFVNSVSKKISKKVIGYIK
jgi:hypothetical protein